MYGLAVLKKIGSSVCSEMPDQYWTKEVVSMVTTLISTGWWSSLYLCTTCRSVRVTTFFTSCQQCCIVSKMVASLILKILSILCLPCSLWADVRVVAETRRRNNPSYFNIGGVLSNLESQMYFKETVAVSKILDIFSGMFQVTFYYINYYRLIVGIINCIIPIRL